MKLAFEEEYDWEEARQREQRRLEKIYKEICLQTCSTDEIVDAMVRDICENQKRKILEWLVDKFGEEKGNKWKEYYVYNDVYGLEREKEVKMLIKENPMWESWELLKRKTERISTRRFQYLLKEVNL